MNVYNWFSFSLQFLSVLFCGLLLMVLHFVLLFFFFFLSVYSVCLSFSTSSLSGRMSSRETNVSECETQRALRSLRTLTDEIASTHNFTYIQPSTKRTQKHTHTSVHSRRMKVNINICLYECKRIDSTQLFWRMRCVCVLYAKHWHISYWMCSVLNTSRHRQRRCWKTRWDCYTHRDLHTYLNTFFDFYIHICRACTLRYVTCQLLKKDKMSAILTQCYAFRSRDKQSNVYIMCISLFADSIHSHYSFQSTYERIRSEKQHIAIDRLLL